MDYRTEANKYFVQLTNFPEDLEAYDGAIELEIRRIQGFKKMLIDEIKPEFAEHKLKTMLDELQYIGK